MEMVVVMMATVAGDGGNSNRGSQSKSGKSCIVVDYVDIVAAASDVGVAIVMRQVF